MDPNFPLVYGPGLGGACERAGLGRAGPALDGPVANTASDPPGQTPSLGSQQAVSCGPPVQNRTGQMGAGVLRFSRE